MASERAERFMRTLQEAERSGNVEPLVAMFAGGATLGRHTRPELEEGPEGARRFWREYLFPFSRIESTFTHVSEGPDGAALEWTSSGALSNGEPLEYRGVSLLEFTGDLVSRFRTYYDSAAFLPEGAKTRP